MKPTVFQLRALVMLTASVFACSSVMAAPTSTSKTAKAPVVASSAAGSPPCNQVEVGAVVRLSVGKSTLIRPPLPVARMLLGNPQNTPAARPSEAIKFDDGKSGMLVQQHPVNTGAADLDVLLLSPTEIYLLGKTVGSTNIILLDRAGRCTMIDVVVGIDTASLNASLKEILPGENDIKITSAADSLVVSGVVSDSVVVERVMDIASAYVREQSAGATGGTSRIINLMEVKAPQQVMLEVKVAEISKSLLDQFGINFSRAYSPADGSMVRFLTGLFGGKGLLTGQISGTTGGTVGLGLVGSVTSNGTTVGNTIPAGSASIGGSSITLPILAGKNATTISSDAQKQDGLVKILAEPTVMAISGQEGSFLAGGKIFIPVSNNNGSGGTSITLEEKEFGVSLKFTPTVLAGGRINLKVNPEVSELSSQGIAITATNVSGTSILPAFTTRRASTTVQLLDGQSFAIGGLMKNNVSSSITAFPFLGELPIIGALFRSTSFQNDRSELVFVVTPHLVKPLSPDYVLPTDAYSEPSRYDMIMNGKLEGRSPAAHQPEDRTPTNPPPVQGGFEVK
ncbi:type II and III secretion system protein family protein [Uliginosibacterium gangwonense]|uniref:type II and III secretion system protein family protein n=1 Tax=Uliginosibacterium gangwonense TaxID=392736 RepID=UPI0003A35901|nr:type II and III secretion system protein family protein [Uliginosibacterium gangwonense]